jgi:hypothetical protein
MYLYCPRMVSSISTIEVALHIKDLISGSFFGRPA